MAHNLNSSLLSVNDRYSTILRALHWLVLLAVVVAVASILTEDIFPKGSAGRIFLRSTHYLAGVTVLILMTFRIFARSLSSAPTALPGAPWMQKSASAMHVFLYALMLAMPITGLGIVLLSGKPIDIYGLGFLSPFEANRALSRTIKEVHETGGTLVYIAVGMHAAAALWHQFILRDKIFNRVL